jgi:hypothetical protein
MTTLTREEAQSRYGCVWKTITNWLKALGLSDTNPRSLDDDLIALLDRYKQGLDEGKSSEQIASQIKEEQCAQNLESFDSVGFIVEELNEQVGVPAIHAFFRGLPELLRQVASTNRDEFATYFARNLATAHHHQKSASVTGQTTLPALPQQLPPAKEPPSEGG